jgi:hypothetical protein
MLFNNGCMTKRTSHELGEVETDGITQVGQFNYKVTKSMRINSEMKDTIIDKKLRQSLNDEALLLCGGMSNVESHSHLFNDAIHMSHGLTDREQKRPTGFYRKITGYIRCHDESVQHVSTTKINEKQYQTIKETTVFAHSLSIEDYKPALGSAVTEEAKRQCVDSQAINISNEFSSISSTTFHSDEAETHIIKVIGNITCQ